MTEQTVRACFVAVLGAGPRPADVSMMLMMAGVGLEEEDATVLGEYLWDHWLGEPDSPTLEEIVEKCRVAIKGEHG